MSALVLGPNRGVSSTVAAAPRLERRLRDLLTGTEQLLRRAHLTEAQIRECAAILDESFQRIREVLRDTR